MMQRDYSPDWDWHESTVADMCNIAALMGWDIKPKAVYFSGFWSQGDGASFTGTLGYSKGCLKAVKNYAPLDTELHRIAKDWQELAKRHGYRMEWELERISSRYVHQNTVRCYDNDEATEIARGLMRWLYNALERDFDYQTEWNKAQHWIELLESARDAYNNARQAVTDYRATLASPCAARLPASVMQSARNAPKAALRAWRDYLEDAESIGDAGDMMKFINLYM